MARSIPPRATAGLTVPPRYPTSLIFLDESGSVTGGRHFTIGGVKLRESGAFARDIQDLRDRYGFRSEFKFNEINRGSLSMYFDLIDRLYRSDAHIAACVVDALAYDPFTGKGPPWLAHARVAAQLLVGCINRNELVGVLLDGISTPRGCSFDDVVRGMVNKRLRATSVVTAACLDSRTNDSLQVADLVASAVAFERRRAAGISGKPNSNKAKVAARLGLVFGCPDLPDGRKDRVRIATYRGTRTKRPRVQGDHPGECGCTCNTICHPGWLIEQQSGMLFRAWCEPQARSCASV